MLLMKRRFIELIKAGKKRQTIRLWAYPRVRRGQRIRPGDRHRLAGHGQDPHRRHPVDRKQYSAI